jgi:hypothetical protein
MTKIELWQKLNPNTKRPQPLSKLQKWWRKNPPSSKTRRPGGM